MIFKLFILWYYWQFRWHRPALYDKKKLAILQQKRMRAWRKNLTRSPFYQAWARAPLDAFPRLNKQTHLQHFDEINTAGIKKEEALDLAFKAEASRDFAPTIGPITVGLSSGTSGTHGIFLASPRERAEWVAAILDRVIGWSWKKRKVAFFLRANSNLYESTKSRLLQFEFFDTTQDLKLEYPRLQNLLPDILIGQPSVLKTLAADQQKGILQLAPTQVISVAEVLEERDQAQIEQAFKVRVDQVYQCTEGFLAHTCEVGNLHLNEDWLIVERRYLDDQQLRFHPIITDLARKTQPIIRYELNDILLEGGPCPCGRVTQMLTRIEGRADEAFVFSQNTGKCFVMYPDTIRRLVIQGGRDALQDYHIRQCSPQQIEVALSCADESKQSEIEERIRHELFHYFERWHFRDIEIVISPYQAPKPGQKLIRIKNETHLSL